MLSGSELQEIQDRWTPKAGIYQGPHYPSTSLMVTASMNDAVSDVPRLLAEIGRLADELDHWRKRALFAEQFIPRTSEEPAAPQ